MFGLRRLILIGGQSARKKLFTTHGSSIEYDNKWTVGLGTFMIAAISLENNKVSNLDGISDVVHVNKVKELRDRIKDLKETCEEARWLDDGDYTLNRFLISRNCNVKDAEEMFRGTVEWRIKYNIRDEFNSWKSHDSEEKHLAHMYGYASRAGFTEDGIPLNFERYVVC